MIEVVDKIIAEFRGGRGGKEASGYEFHISHETSESHKPRADFRLLSSFKPDSGFRPRALSSSSARRLQVYRCHSRTGQGQTGT
jgi:hypothetical protein